MKRNYTTIARGIAVGRLLYCITRDDAGNLYWGLYDHAHKTAYSPRPVRNMIRDRSYGYTCLVCYNPAGSGTTLQYVSDRWVLNGGKIVDAVTMWRYCNE